MKRWILLVVLLYCGGCGLQNADDSLIADFEGKTYGDWKAAGEAFGPGPAKGTLAGQMDVGGYEGKGLANSYYKGDKTTGTLTSPPFEIQRKYINFLIGGGKHPGKTCINLLVDDKVVRTATGPNDQSGGSEALDWHNWDVSDLGGKTAVIQIVDQATGGWGHINIDHILQSSNKKSAAEKVPESREMVFAKKYLNMPVKHGATKRTMDILIDGKIVRQFVIELAEGEPDYWVFLNVGEFKGKTATLKLNVSAGKSNGLEKIYQHNSIKEADTFYKEKNRQQFHFSSRRGWNNDSNGMVYYDGEYHLFYQHNPYGWAWGNMTWGHAVSTDSVHWKELDDAIHPDHLGTIYSGSAVVDENNTAGFQTGGEKVIVCIYTSAAGKNDWSKGRRFTQSIAYSNDRGRTWTVYEGNPVIEHINGSNRDPKVIWHTPTNQWVMALYLDGSEMGFFTSKDLKNWKLESRLKGFHECPELFELPVDGDKNNMQWVFYGAKGDYFLGDFDGKEFKPDGEAIRFHSGNCFYASQTFSNIPESDGRRIQIAWGRIKTPGMPFNQCMLFPVELTLHTTEEGVRMFAKPIKEIETLHGRKHSIGTVLLDGEKTLDGLKGELFHITAEFSPAGAAEFGLTVRGVPITYNVAKNTLSCKGKKAQLKLKDGKIKLELLVDRNSIEIFANDGRVYMPIGSILAEDNKSIELFTKGGKTKVQALEVYELNSAWR